MNSISFQDPRTNDLISRVSEDVSLLRQDISNLFSHTTRHTIPSTAHKLADNAKTRLANGRHFTAEHLRSLKNQVNQPAAAWVGGAVAVGLLAAGAYLLLRNHCAASCEKQPEQDD